jgi:acylphosphatase
LDCSFPWTLNFLPRNKSDGQNIIHELAQCSEEQSFYLDLQDPKHTEDFIGILSAMIKWNVYEITSQSTSIHGVKFRGRIRKYAISQDIDVLVENSSDKENCVRFAVTKTSDADKVVAFINSIVSDAIVDNVLTDVVNPVLSKLNVNQSDRYEILL